MNASILSQRQQEILALLKNSAGKSVEELAEHFQVTPTTIRREFTYLEDNLLIVRSRGYARIASENIISPFNIRCDRSKDEKILIARKALEYIHPHDTIIMDSGTSIYMLATQMAAENLNKLVVVTNSLPVANVLSGKCRVMVCGGMLEETTMSLLGPNADAMMESVVADKLFLGATGIRLNIGLTVTAPLQYNIKTKMLKSAEQNFILVDSSKFNTIGVNVFCKLADVGTVITVRNRENADAIEKLQKAGVRIDYVDCLEQN